jgi:hypothetical protein
VFLEKHSQGTLGVNAPPLKFRSKGKSYGRAFAKAHFGREWANKYNDNLKKANKWLQDALDQNNTKRDDETKWDWLGRICIAKIEKEKQVAMASELDDKIHMEPLDFQGVVMIWQLNDIVEHLVERIV